MPKPFVMNRIFQVLELALWSDSMRVCCLDTTRGRQFCECLETFVDSAVKEVQYLRMYHDRDGSTIHDSLGAGSSKGQAENPGRSPVAVAS